MMALLLGGCSAGHQVVYRRVRLTALTPLGVLTGQKPSPAVLRVAAAGVVSPQATVRYYDRLFEYIGQRLHRSVEVLQRGSYAEINDLIRAGTVDLAVVCSRAYVVGHREFGMELLVVPQIRGRTTYHSLIIVPRNSPARKVGDLRGKVFAFSDPLSNSGRLAPTYLLYTMGTAPQAFFARTLFTYSHDRSVEAVTHHLVDGAAVDSLVYNGLCASYPEIKERTRVLWRSPPYAMSPFVVPPQLPISLKRQLRKVLLAMDKEAEGQALLTQLQIDRFVLIPDSAYDSIRAMEKQLSPQP